MSGLSFLNAPLLWGMALALGPDLDSLVVSPPVSPHRVGADAVSEAVDSKESPPVPHRAITSLGRSARPLSW